MFYRTTLLALAAGLYTLPALAETTDVAPDPACIYKETDLKTYGGQPYAAPEEIKSVKGQLNVDLNVALTDPNKTKIAGCGVTLRSYNGKLVGPTLRVKPGDTLNITLNNQLDPDGSNPEEACHNQHDMFGGSPLPEQFNCTNLHTHGLHVSPKGNADNILVVVPPFEYDGPDDKNSNLSANPRQIKIEIPKNHAPGTFWYHPHVHGSTGVQVASGMEGAIIVEDDDKNTPQSIVKANANEKIFMLQTIPYDDTGNYLSQVDTWVNNWEQKDYCCTGKWDQEQTFKLKRQAVELIPGSRSDVLVRANQQKGRYLLTADTYISGRLDPSTASYVNYIVAYVDIDGAPVADTGLPTNAEMSKLYPYVNIKDSNVKYNQIATFNRDQPQGGNDGGIACDPDRDKTPCYPIGFQVNGQVFDANQPRYLQLRPSAEEQAKEDKNGPQTGTDSWIVSSADPTRNHVFHIHTNDFQTTRTDPLGKTETLWRDSLLVKYGQPQTILTRYEDFDGKAVMHCHLLSHEDMGMMQVIQFTKRDAAGIAGH